MRETEASEAQGEAPVTTSPQQEIDDAIEGIMDLRKLNGKITFEELRSAREEGLEAAATALPHPGA